jgi:hypothetical protein
MPTWPPSRLPSPFSYDPYKYMRGLVIDKKRGNLLKLDRHKYVKVAPPAAVYGVLPVLKTLLLSFRYIGVPFRARLLCASIEGASLPPL